MSCFRSVPAWSCASRSAPTCGCRQQIAAGRPIRLTFADLAWWEVYADTTLQGLIRRTLACNKDVQIAAARIEEMAALKRIRTAALLPELNGAVTAERERENYRGDGAANDDEFGVKATAQLGNRPVG